MGSATMKTSYDAARLVAMVGEAFASRMGCAAAAEMMTRRFSDAHYVANREAAATKM